MADARITELTELATPNTSDVLAIVDVDDTAQDATGTSKQITVQNLKRFQDGEAATPSMSFYNDMDTGLYRIGADNLGIAVNGVNQVDISPSVLTVPGTVIFGSSSGTSNASYLFETDPDTKTLATTEVGVALQPYWQSKFTAATAQMKLMTITSKYNGSWFDDSVTSGQFYGIAVQPLVKLGTTTGATVLSNSYGLYFKPTLLSGSGGYTESITNQYAIYAWNNMAVPVTNSIGIYAKHTSVTGITTNATGIAIEIGTTLGSVTTAVGLDITAINAGTTKWGMKIGDYQSYHQGKIAFGGTTAPTYGIDMQATTGDEGCIGLTEVTTTPTAPATSAGVVIYMKADKLIVSYQDGATRRYKYLTLTGTSGTWTHTTSAP